MTGSDSYMSLSICTSHSSPRPAVSLCSYSFIRSFKALEKNKQWLEYDQQREAYVRAILDKMLWLEKHLNETNQAHSKQHNEEHSDGESKGQWAASIHH